MGRDEADFETLVDGYLDQIRQGSAMDVDAFMKRHPDYATELKTLLPMMLAMEHIGRDDEKGDDSSMSLSLVESRQLGDYEIVREIGRGGMGIVYEAQQMSLGRRVALKVLTHRANDPSFAERFDREARAVAKLDHPGIVKVYEVSSDANVPFYSMQFIQGASVDRVISELRLLRQHKSEAVASRDQSTSDVSAVAALLSKTSSTVVDSGDTNVSVGNPSNVYYRRVAEIGIQVGQAIQHAHQQGVLHRDIKPANILLDMSGAAWITDFGLAKADTDEGLTRTGDLVGTMRYMAPEAMRNQSDVRSEVYSLGLTLYELLALRPAFPETDRYRLMHSVLNNKPRVLRSVDSRIPVDLETIVLKACDREPVSRYSSAESLAADLKRFLNDEPIHARRVSSPERLVRWSRRNRGLAAALLIVASLLCCLTVASTIAAVYFRDLNDRLTQTVAQLETTQRSEIAAKHNAEARAVENLRLAQEAEEAEQAAESNGRIINRNLYFARMMLAGQTANDAIGISRVSESISRWQPKADGMDLRGWEWFYLTSHCNRADIVCEDLLSPIYWASWSPDGARLATSGDGRDIEIWDTKTGQHQMKLVGHDASVRCVEWSPDGKALISAGGPVVMLWDADTGDGHRIFDSRSSVINRAAWDAPGDRIAIAADGEIRILDVDGKTLKTIQVAGGPVRSLSWHPDGQSIATPLGEREIAIWSTETGAALRVFQGHGRRVRSVQWNPKGNKLGSVSHDKTLRIWDTRSGSQLREVALPQSGRSIRWSPDGKTVVVSGDDHAARIIRADRVHLQLPLLGHTNVVAFANFSPDGLRIATASADSSARIWNAHHGTAFTLAGVHGEDVNAVDWSPDGKRVVSASSDQTAVVRNVSDATDRVGYNDHKANITCCRFSADGKRVASGDLSGQVRIWDATSGETLCTEQFASPVFSLCWSFDSAELLCGSKNGNINRIKANSGAMAGVLGKHDDVVLDLALSHDGRRISSCSADRTVRIWDADSGECLQTLSGAKQRINAIAWSPDDAQIIAGSTDSRLRIYDVAKNKMIRELRGHNGSVFAVTWNADGSRIASGGTDRKVRIWDPASGEMTLTIANNTATIRRLEFSPNGLQIAIASRDSTVQILDASIGYAMEGASHSER